LCVQLKVHHVATLEVQQLQPEGEQKIGKLMAMEQPTGGHILKP
jgi:hypothetical protein